MQHSRELPAPRRGPPPRQATYELEISIVVPLVAAFFTEWERSHAAQP